MGDVIDRAQSANEVYQEAAMRTFQAKHRQASSGPHLICIDCEQPIPEARRKANPEATRCIGCQSKKERMDRSLG
jgi:DnaK suppressor protein